jgi:hypothetical protein
VYLRYLFGYLLLYLWRYIGISWSSQIFPSVDQPRLIKMLCYLDLVDLLNLSGGKLWQIRCEGVLHNAPPFKQLLRSCVSNLGKKKKKFLSYICFSKLLHTDCSCISISAPAHGYSKDFHCIVLLLSFHIIFLIIILLLFLYFIIFHYAAALSLSLCCLALSLSLCGG